MKPVLQRNGLVFSFKVGDTLRYFNAFHSSKSWCCVGDDFTPDTISQWIDRDLLVIDLKKTLLVLDDSELKKGDQIDLETIFIR